MGSFNATCSISNLAINDGEKAVFLPLIPNRFTKKKVHELKPSKMIVYPNDLFNPFCLPIKGTYDSYGSLNNIIRDENVKIIEDYFGISIEQIVEAIGEERDIYSTVGTLFKSYVIHKEMLSSYEVKMDEEFLIKLGFTKKDQRYQFKDYPYYVELVPSTTRALSDGMGFRFKNEKEETLTENDGYGARRELLKQFEKETGYMINVAPENQDKVRLLSSLSGMFIHGEIYEEMISFSKNQKFEKEYEDFYKKLKNTSFDSKKSNRMQALLEDMVEKITNTQEKEQIQALMDLQKEKGLDVLDYELSQHPFIALFKDSQYFQAFYIQPLKEGKLKEPFVEYKAFYWSMYECNRFYFPSIYSSEMLETDASKMLLKKSLEIINKKR